MTQVTARREGGDYMLVMEGHATGAPLVCAGASSIAASLKNYLRNEENVVLHQLVEEAGRFEARFSGQTAAEAVWKMAVMGLLSLQMAAPDAVEVKIFSDRA